MADENAEMDLVQKFVTPDGQQFDTRREAQDYLRRPKIEAALNGFIDDNADLVKWLIENQETVTDAFQAGTIRRVSKSERNKLEKALDHVKSLNDPKLAFLKDNADAIAETFRWPTVKRMDDDQKAALAKEQLTLAAEGQEEVADFVIENKDAILEAFEAGKVKKPINPKALAGLAEYRERMAREKAEKEAAEGATKAPAKKK
jgi:dsDNA-binding SOS-regulon protein